MFVSEAPNDESVGDDFLSIRVEEHLSVQGNFAGKSSAGIEPSGEEGRGVSKFLRVGIISDVIEDILEASDMLIQALESGNVSHAEEFARDIRDMAQDLKQFLSRWKCEPIIYTGRGTTDELIRVLENLMNQVEGQGSVRLQD